jgi:WD40 repeat protein
VYDAFVSYSHAADGRLAPAVQAGLQRLARPWYRVRALRVFRDDTGLTVNPHLWDSITAAMDESRFFVLLASPDAAASTWVNREIEHWVQHHGAERILVVLTEGDLVWDAGRGDYASRDSNALPAALRGCFVDEPRHLDLRWAHDDQRLELGDSRFREAIADLAAPIHGQPKEELESEDVRQHRRVRRLARLAVASLCVLGVVAVAFGVFALAQRGAARHQARVANSRELAAQATASASTEPDLALLLAIEGYRLNDSFESRRGLVAALAANPALVQVRRGFGSQVVDAAPSPDGRRVAVGNGDGSLRVFDLRTAKPTTPRVHAGHGGIYSLAFSPDGRFLASGSAPGGEVRVWDARTGKPVTGSLSSEQVGVVGIAFSPDGSQLVATGLNGTLHRWSMPGPTPIGDPISLQSALPLGGRGALFTPDGRTILTIKDQFTVRFVDAATGTLSNDVIDPHEQTYFGHAIAVSPDGKLGAVGDGRGRVSLFDLATRTPHGPPLLASQGFAVTSVSFNADGSQLVVGSTDGRVSVWDVASGTPIEQPFTGHRDAVWRAWFMPDGHVASMSTAELAIWTPRHRTVLGRLEGTVSSFELQHPAPQLYEARGNREGVGGIAAIDSTTVALGNRDGTIRFRDTRTGRQIAHPVISGAEVGAGLAISPDHKTLAFAVGNIVNRGEDPGIRVELWSLPSHHQLGQISLHNFPTGLAYSPDGRRLAVGEDGGEIEVLDARTGTAAFPPMKAETRSSPTSTQGSSYAVAFSPDGRLLASGGSDGQAWLWNAGTGKQLRRIGPERQFQVTGLAFAPSGRLIAETYVDGYLALVDTNSRHATGEQLSVNGGSGDVAGFSSDGRLLAAGGDEDHAVTIWDVDRRLPVGGPLAGHHSVVSSVAFADHDQTLVSGAQDGTTAFRQLRPQTWERQACTIAGRNLTRTEWHQYLGNTAYHRTCPQWPSG